ncbi:MAG: ATP-dependent RNA helicase dbp10 [Chaenotheca gracillima]|nr:MAG: ATP-dependent RNA helicase dbp10 [Chaenotheca gracillima]
MGPNRAPSPAASENELDISNALFNGANDSSDGEDREPQKNASKKLKGNGPANLGLLDMNQIDEDGEGDEAFIALQQSASNRKSSNLKGKTVKKGGGFQAMGLNSSLLKAITRKGFSVPTPIQRKTIPLVLDGDDVVGMARTGSGKTAAFVVPMIEKLKAHSAKVGARGLILSPSRELALQTLKVVKELGKGTDLTCVLLVGGDSLEDQFGFMAANPDIIIATPGRFLHLQVEMSLDLFSVRYVVFDEADRLFEMGFAAQLAEILHALPASRQTLLFSATLPKSLVEFARAGLQEPKLVRLDAETKVSSDLESAFFTVKSSEKEGALLHILNDIIKVPTGSPEAATKAKNDAEKSSKKRKRGSENLNPKDSPTEHSTIIFTATKHHVDYLASMLRLAGFAVSHAYGSLDQTARNAQVQDFRAGKTNLLVVTDVAARGIDIPVLANVINYDFPPQPKIFVHRVGRTARAGKRGWSYSILREMDAPYLLDLQLFLGRRLVLGQEGGRSPNFAQDVVVGGLVRDQAERSSEWANKLLDQDSDLAGLGAVAAKGEKLYVRTRNSASNESVKRGKEIVASKSWMSLNPLFSDETDQKEAERESMLARVSGFRPQETVFEIGKKGHGGEAAEVMRKRRAKIDTQRQRNARQSDEMDAIAENKKGEHASPNRDEDSMDIEDLQDAAMDSASEEELEVTFSQPEGKHNRKSKDNWKDSEHFMSYTPTSTNAAEDRGYGVHSGSYNTASQNANFVEAARGATMDMTNDEGAKSWGAPTMSRGMRWDKKNKKYVSRSNDDDGSKGSKMVRGESGQKIAASFRSGRFDAWRKSNKVDRLPRTGQDESKSASNFGNQRFKHKQTKTPKEADKYRDDYHKQKKKFADAKENRIGKFSQGGGKSELRSVDDVRKQRNLSAKKKEKNARPARR